MKIKAYMKEIQYRLFFTFFTFISNTIIIYLYKEELIFLLGQHQTGEFPHFITTNLPEVFFCFIKLSIFMGLYFTFPIAIIQLWFFIIPALYKYEYEKIKTIITSSLLIYLAGSLTTYTIFLPYCWQFFSAFELNYENNGISVQLETRFHEYLDFFIEIFFSLNITLHFCLILCFFLVKFPINNLIKLRKIIYFFSFLLATLVTPPDIVSQIFLGLLLIFIYEFLLLSIFFKNKYKKKGE